MQANIALACEEAASTTMPRPRYIEDTVALARCWRLSCPRFCEGCLRFDVNFDVPLEKWFSTPLIFAEFMPTGFRRPERAIAAIRPDLISIRTVRRPKLHTPPPDPRRSLPTSVVLQRLLDEMPAGHFTLGWLMGSLRKRSFGIIMLVLAVVAMAPGVSIVAGLLLMIPAFQMMAAQPAPAFPRCIADRPLPTRDLAALVQRAVPVLRYLEKVIHPRWPTPLEATKRLVGTVVVILNTTLLFTPIPLSNVVPALLIALISLAYLEEDGLLLSIALLVASIMLTVELVAVWQMVRGANWIVGLW